MSAKSDSPTLIAVIPAYDEESRLPGVIGSVRSYVTSVIVVDDGSTDQTAQVSEQAGAIVLRHSENCGAGAATMTGLEAARRLGAERVVTIDADGQHNPRDIPLLLREMDRTGADLVIGNRFGGRKGHIPFIRRCANTLGNVLTFFVTGIYLPDTQCGFKLFGARALVEVDLKMAGFEFCTEIIREAARFRWTVVSVPTKVVYSEYTLAKGQSFSGGIRTAAKILLRSFLR